VRLVIPYPYPEMPERELFITVRNELTRAIPFLAVHILIVIFMFLLIYNVKRVLECVDFG